MDKLKEGSDNVGDQIDNAGNKIDRFCMVVRFSFIHDSFKEMLPNIFISRLSLLQK